ncbi:hypothetical protein BN903_144 [Halorubrum sp. AJ67]|nr:hypothetical protein BN903_144 [Halorubrum sp. AJ67]
MGLLGADGTGGGVSRSRPLRVGRVPAVPLSDRRSFKRSPGHPRV